ncbi:hypothetical protein JI739_08955 [Ramlibacter sp. AW1]|uniref:DUF3304 domain-containing protein n=1 Tax=Ramlibacter aurantiacus TaxID=2801330 RepID=A0A937D1F4_9BURK|nr:hypothetical protein [Ramlibacter aurantiacus]MBL0420469.1 hypothetical protein [Ramlibacter aurantiacus]
MRLTVTRSAGKAFSARSLLRVIAALLLAVALAACATRPHVVAHGFTFDGWDDHWYPQITVLEYAYGDKYHMTRKKNENGLPPGTSVFGDMPVAKFLYVRWRLKATGQTFEERVDLRDRLPADLSGHDITFVIDGSQLYVFVVTPEQIKVRLTKRPLKTWWSTHRVSYEIFPAVRSPDRTHLGEAAPWAPASREH